MTVPFRIPMLDLRPEIQKVSAELNEAFQRVMRSGEFILGPELKAFENEMAAYLGVRHAVGVNSGTDALVIGLRALDIGPGDEVITTPFTFFATAEAIGNVGATPVFADIDPRTFNIDPELIEAAVTERTKAILPVHLFGQACEMDPIMELAGRHELTVLEDCAQALGGAYKGRKVGTFGDAAALSFFPSKNLGGFGDGGMLVTDRDDVAELARMLRAHGAKRKYDNEMLGYNSRLDELQAALLRVKLRHLDAGNELRRRIAHAYDQMLVTADIVIPTVGSHVQHVYHQYTVRVEDGQRDDRSAALASRGIASAVYYARPLDTLAPFSGEHPCPQAAASAQRVLSLPMVDGCQEQVAEALREAGAAT